MIKVFIKKSIDKLVDFEEINISCKLAATLVWLKDQEHPKRSENEIMKVIQTLQ